MRGRGARVVMQVGWATALSLLIFGLEMRIASLRDALPQRLIVSGGGGVRFPPAALDDHITLLLLVHVCMLACLWLGLELVFMALPPARRPRRRVVQLCCVIGLVGVLTNAELSVRIFCEPYRRMLTFRPDPDLFWTFNPDGTTRGFVINSDGFRGQDFPRERVPGEFRILCLGDSISAGHNLVESQTYPFQLRAMLQKRYPNRVIRVQNCAINGYSISQGATVLERFGPTYQPDLVLVGHSYCEMETLDPNGDLPASHRPPIAPLRRLLYQSVVYLFLRYQVAGDVSFFHKPDRGWAQQPRREQLYRRHLDRLVEWAQAHHVRLMLFYPTIINDRGRPAPEPVGNALSMAVVAQRSQIPFLFLGWKWAGRSDLKERLPDGVHPDPQGAVLLASDLAEFIVSRRLVESP